MPYRKGESGNPKGRPAGSKHRATIAAETLLAGEAQALTRKAIELAMSGDTVALRLCMERIIPAQKAGRTVKLDLPKVEQLADLVAVLGSITEAVATGVVTPEEGLHLAGIFEQQRRMIELVQIEQRIAALEARHG